MEKKKLYIAPNLNIVKAELQSMIAASPTKKLRNKKFDLAVKWAEQGDVEEDADLAISSKNYNAWDTWDE